ncbi:glycosyltransferase family 2 protein [Pseudonocardia alni]|uniref:glycosyltransferase family 2 protein n=1 Tax=Pseudonocardia alni TaxID=33907 RepID=UPI001AD6609F|nr:glycosyltransferase family 2 protein [Pseudonocardia alni]MBO4239526.1 glycosyltransferase family 2 protein [Pseudonocardia alni]
MSAPAARVAVVTVVRGRAGHLARQRRVLAAGPRVTHVVVGMGAEPATDGAGPPTRVLTVPAPGPLPLAAARNAGADAALAGGATLLVFLDVDCLPGDGLVDGYLRAAARRSDALLCGPVTYLPAGVLPERDLHHHTDPHPARPAPADGALVAEPRRELFWSLSFAVTADAWRAGGGFCEDYAGYGGEDTDFALSCGLDLVWVGGAHAYHQHHPPARTDPARIAEIVANARLFHDRWGWWPMAGWLRELHATGAVDFDPRRDVLRVG